MTGKNAARGIRAALLILASLTFAPRMAHALPSFARQTGMACIACHTEFPILTDFGRAFKLNGYTLSTGATTLPPLAAFLQPSFTQTNQGQAGGAAPHFGPNSNAAITQASFFYSGRLFGPYPDMLLAAGPIQTFLDKFGIFSQATIDGVARQFHWDNLELRYADTGTVAGHQLIYGFFANNNPGMEDPWNTTPAWTFPFSTSGVAPIPAVGTLIEGALAQEVVGAGAYAMISNTVYLEMAGYHTPDKRFLRAVGISPDGQPQIPDIAPYWRAAYTTSAGNHSWEIGTSGMYANTYPGRVNSAGEDHTLDLGLDTEYQTSINKNDLTGLFSLYRELDDFSADRSLGNSSNSADTLWSFKGNIDYLYDKTYGFDAGYFLVNGRRDFALYSNSPNGSPESDGEILELVWEPINKNGGPAFWPRSNVKFSLQYTIYNRFNGTHAHASGNNTLYLESWIDF
jgi:hypothetical protein